MAPASEARLASARTYYFPPALVPDPMLIEKPMHLFSSFVQETGVIGDGRALGSPLMVSVRLSQLGIPASAWS